jgi:hypothetical protein
MFTRVVQKTAEPTFLAEIDGQRAIDHCQNHACQ